MIQAGDVVIGTLPVNLAAQVCAKGARYLHLVLPLTESDRHRELTAADMENMGATLEEYSVRRVGNAQEG